MEADVQKNVAREVSIKVIIANTFLAVLMFMAGFLSNSAAMISDAVHTTSDVFSTFAAMAGVLISEKKPDREHPYGYDRFECVAAIVLSAVLFMVGLGIGHSGVEKITLGLKGELEAPGSMALFAAGAGILVKEWMFRVTKAASEKISSGAFMASAWHHRLDALSSAGSLLAIALARMGLPIFDPIVSLVICLLIFKIAYEIFKDAVDKLTDRACDVDTAAEMSRAILSQEGVMSLDSIMTRRFGAKIYVDVEIGVCGDLKVTKSHDIARLVSQRVESFDGVKGCMVRVNPAN